MIKPYLLLFFLAIVSNAFAQTANEIKLQEAVQKYNTLRSESDKLTAASSIYEITEICGKFIDLDKDFIAITNPDSDQMTVVISYFRMNTLYEAGYNYGRAGMNNEAYDILKGIEFLVSGFVSADFPLRYQYFGKAYSIQYSNFQPTKYQYYVGYAEICNNLGKTDEALEKVRMSESVRISENALFNRCIALNIGTKIKESRQEYDREQADFCINMMESYSNLSDDYLKEYAKSKQDLSLKGWERLQKTLNSSANLSPNGDYYKRAVAPLAKFNHLKEAAEAYKKAISANCFDRAFLFEAFEFGMANDQNISLIAADRLMYITGNTDCNEWDKISGLYLKLDNTDKVSAAAKKASECRKAQARAIKKANQNFHLYVGTYPFRYMTKTEKMDFNGIVGILSGKTMINLSAAKVRQKRYYFSDLWINSWESTDDNWKPTWDGFEADLSIRFANERFNKTGSYSYFGPRFGYARKTLSAVGTNVTDKNGYTTFQTFNPVDEQIQIMFESGGIVYGKTLALDMNIGFGAYYGSFSTGNPDFILEENHYENILLEYEMAKRWGPVLKFNISLGFML